MTDQEHRVTYVPLFVLSTLAILAAIALAFVFSRSAFAVADALLWMEGTALLASSMQPNDDRLGPWYEKLSPSGFASGVSFVPLLYWPGLFLLAAAAFMGAFSK